MSQLTLSRPKTSGVSRESGWPGLPPMVPGLVSVVIVGYNNWPDLEMAIQSALHQSYRPVEVIVVDNSSSDATPVEVPKLFGSAVRYVRQHNRGAASGYNTGVQHSQGEFVQILEGDDLLAPTKIEKQVEVFRSDPDVDITYGEVRAFHALGGPHWWRDKEARAYQDMVAALIDADTDSAGFLAHTLLYRRRALELVGRWDETLLMTLGDHWLRSAWAGCRFLYSPQSLCFYRRRPGQISEDIAALRRGSEVFWIGTLEYVKSEPYQSAILDRLSRVRFHMANHRDGLTRRQALPKLAQARATSPTSIPWAAMGLGGLLVLLPGVQTLLHAPELAAVRGPVRRLLRLPENG